MKIHVTNIFSLWVVITFLCVFHGKIFSQQDTLLSDKKVVLSADTFVVDTIKAKKHSPKLATILSAVVPGAGQIYNKKLWYVRVPVIYASGGYLFYSFRKNHNYFKKFNQLIDYMKTDSVSVINISGSDYGLSYDLENQTVDDLTQLREDKRRKRDLSFIGMTAIYLLNILDASVEAYFFDYDISSDLSIHIEPIMIESQNASNIPGIKLNVYF
ncbi:MAG: hypothetical protein Kow0068_20110 [Marinilabiliales bacterium]